MAQNIRKIDFLYIPPKSFTNINAPNGAKYTASALDQLITTLQGQGYEFVPLSQLIYKEGYHMNHEGRQIKDSN